MWCEVAAGYITGALGKFVDEDQRMGVDIGRATTRAHPTSSSPRFTSPPDRVPLLYSESARPRPYRVEAGEDLTRVGF